MNRRRILWASIVFGALLTSYHMIRTYQNSNRYMDIKSWSGMNLDREMLTARRDSFDMYAPDGNWKGYMTQNFYFKEGAYLMEDVSRFSDGSVVEYAAFKIDTSAMKTDTLHINMRTDQGNAIVNLKIDHQYVTGSYHVTKGEQERMIKIDTTYEKTILRNEIYMLINAVEWNIGDQLSLNVLSPLSMAVSKATIRAISVEDLTCQGQNTSCMKLELRSDGKIAENDIWITRASPRRILKFKVLEPALNIILTKTSPN